jgi:hypothetical protein
MAPLNQPPPVFTRGTTISWAYSFYDLFGNVEQPIGTPQIRISFPLAGGATGSVSVLMIPPGGVIAGSLVNTSANAWVATWDSRGAAPGTVYWSIESVPLASPPVAVLDGSFVLTANQANVPTF